MAVLLKNLPLELQNIVCSYMSVPTAKLIKQSKRYVLCNVDEEDELKYENPFNIYYFKEVQTTFKCGYKLVKFYENYLCKCESGMDCRTYYEVDNKYVCELCYTYKYPNLIPKVEWNDWLDE